MDLLIKRRLESEHVGYRPRAKLPLFPRASPDSSPFPDALDFLIPVTETWPLLTEATPPAETPLPASRFEVPAADEGLPGAGPIRRYDRFREMWSSRRSSFAERVEEDQRALVFLGDSITQGGSSFPVPRLRVGLVYGHESGRIT